MKVGVIYSSVFFSNDNKNSARINDMGYMAMRMPDVVHGTTEYRDNFTRYLR